VSASSVDELTAVEVFVCTTHPTEAGLGDAEFAIRVDPRNARSAGLSYDGREPPSVLRRLTTGPIANPDKPQFDHTGAFGPEMLPGERYLQLAHPQDVARRILRTTNPGSKAEPSLVVRYGLFGHDLEKGVVVRGRLRGIWTSQIKGTTRAHAAFREF